MPGKGRAGSNPWRGSVFTLGVFSVLFSLMFLAPMVADLLMGGQDWESFASAFSISAIVGAVCVLSGRSRSIDKSEAVLLTCIVWVVLPALAALPFVFSSTTHLSYTDALFESMSGLTTTGATVLYNLDTKSPGILLWRALLNFIGGLGVVTVGILLLPLLKIVGIADMCGAESSERKFRLGVFKTIQCIICVYVMLCVLCTVLYNMAGMSVFDAICHAMSTISTGGFANYDDSIEHFDSLWIEVIAMVFMLLASCPFVVYLKLIFDGRLQLKQFVVFIGVLLTFSVLGTAHLYKDNIPDGGFFETLWHVTFTFVSLATSTGFVCHDYSGWHFIALSGTILTLCGGCSGSTNSGVKMHRIMILAHDGYKYLRGALQQGFFMTHNTRGTGTELLLRVHSFFFVYILIFCVGCVIVSWIEGDMTTVVTSVSSTFANTGPGLGEIIGPRGTYAPLAGSTKLVLTVMMLIGRLELVPIFVLLFSMFQGGARRLSRIRRGVKMLAML
ncbi:MAG: TrkH family potassium uptake protein [Anaplasma sp.]